MGRKNHLSKIKRLFELQRIMQDKPSYAPDELAQIFGVSKRTIFRDIKTLQAMGVKVRFDRKEGYKIDSRYTLSPVLTSDEAIIIEMALECLPESAKDTFAAQIDVIYQKINAVYNMGELKQKDKSRYA